MAEKYIISIDQSTQGTKALLLDAKANILRREDICHRQIVSDEGSAPGRRRCVRGWRRRASVK